MIDSTSGDETPKLFLINNTRYDLEDIFRWTCDYLDIKNVTVCVSYQFNDTDHEGWVGRDKDIYHIYLKKNIKDVKIVLVHELIHVKQYESNDLIVKTPSTVMYKGDKINLKNSEYFTRPYEVEAHMKDGEILRSYYKHKRTLRKELKE